MDTCMEYCGPYARMNPGCESKRHVSKQWKDHSLLLVQEQLEPGNTPSRAFAWHMRMQGRHYCFKGYEHAATIQSDDEDVDEPCSDLQERRAGQQGRCSRTHRHSELWRGLRHIYLSGTVFLASLRARWPMALTSSGCSVHHACTASILSSRQ